MIKKSKVVATLLSAAIMLSASVTAVTAAEIVKSTSQVEKTYSVVVNGKLIEGVSSFEENGIISVPLAAIVKAMGEEIKWDSETQTAIITQKDQTVIKVTVNKTVAKVNNKDVLLSTKKIDNVIVPTSAKAVIVDGKLHVPVEALKNAFGYSVQVKDKGSEKIVLVQETARESEVKETVKTIAEGGKLDLQYPVPSGWVPPMIRSSDTGDKHKNYNILETELGLIRGGYFNPYAGSDRLDLSTIMVSAGDDDTTALVFYAWYGSKTEVSVENETPYIAREIFRFYFGQKDGLKIFDIMDKGLTGKLKTAEFLNKEFTLNGRKVMIKQTGEAITMFISKK